MAPRYGHHFLPVLIICLIALANALHAGNVGLADRWTSDTTDTFYRIVINSPSSASTTSGGDLDITLWREIKHVFQNQPLTEWYQGLFDAYLRSFHLSYGDISLSYKMVVFPLVLSFCLGAYLLFLYLTGNRWIALGLTLFAVLPMPLSWAGERSGLGPVWTYTRRYFLTATIPLLVWLYFQGTLNSRKLLILSMLCVGLVSNLHSSGIILATILAMTWLMASPINPRRIAQSIGLLATGVILALSSIGSIWTMGLAPIIQLILSSFSTSALAMPFDWIDQARATIPDNLAYLFYPPKIYTHLPRGLIDLWLTLTIALSLLPLALRAARRHRGEDLALFAGAAACLLFVSFEKMWMWVLLGSILFYAGRKSGPNLPFTLGCYLIITTFWVSVGGMLLFQIGYGMIDGFPLVFNQLRGIRFMGFWVFVWLATLIKPSLSSIQASSHLQRLIISMLILIGLVTAQTIYRQYFREFDHDRKEQKSALLEMAAWAQQNTPTTSLFLVGYASFGTVAERAVTHTDKVIRDNKIDWLAPKADKPLSDLLPLAMDHNASHIILAARHLTPAINVCILYKNNFYALAEVGCIATTSAFSPISVPFSEETSPQALAQLGLH